MVGDDSSPVRNLRARSSLGNGAQNGASAPPVPARLAATVPDVQRGITQEEEEMSSSIDFLDPCAVAAKVATEIVGKLGSTEAVRTAAADALADALAGIWAAKIAQTATAPAVGTE